MNHSFRKNTDTDTRTQQVRIIHWSIVEDVITTLFHSPPETITFIVSLRKEF